MTWLSSVSKYWLAWITASSWQLAVLVVLVAVLAWLVQRCSPRLRYALWLLVLIKVFLPPTLSLDWSIGSWAIRPLWNQVQPALLPDSGEARSQSPAVEESHSQRTEDESATSDVPNDLPILQRTEMLFLAWLAGCVTFWTLALRRYLKLKRGLQHMELIDEGPLRIQLEKIALDLGVTNLPDLYLSQQATSPFLLGLTRARIVLPRNVVEDLSHEELDGVLQHELNHWRRRDTWIGWVQVVAQGLFWFHPLVWFANARLRHERECVCDEAVLRSGSCEPTSYGETLLAVIKSARGRSSVHGSLVGIFEPGANIQKRLEEIMSYQAGKRSFGKWSYLFLAMFAAAFLPMAMPSLATETAASSPADVAEKPKVRAWPWIVKTEPAVGATEVDPSLSEITVTFDRDMGKGMSWTGNEKFFMPPIPSGSQAHWRDDRTCVLPVKLKRGEYYRVGINSTGFQNFKSSEGAPAPCSVIYFTTSGASKATLSRLRVPKLVKMVPANNASDVDVDTSGLRVTFDLPMGGGMSWTGGGPSFPEAPEGARSRWNRARKTCILPVELKPDHQYRLGLNSYSHINFQSKWGVPMEAVAYTFKTADSSE